MYGRGDASTGATRRETDVAGVRRDRDASSASLDVVMDAAREDPSIISRKGGRADVDVDARLVPGLKKGELSPHSVSPTPRSTEAAGRRSGEVSVRTSCSCGVRGIVVAAWLDEDAQAELKHGSRRAVRGHLGLLHLKADLERRECLASVVEMSIVSASAAMRSRAALPFRESRRVREVVIFVHMMLVAVS
ncbi:hypothetical protein L1887_43419 [Cichorium endivia]|nr:hypothetical protein L1887_43419 [Cichorium endivia]